MVSGMHLVLFAGLLVWTTSHGVSGRIEVYGVIKPDYIWKHGWRDSIPGTKKGSRTPENDRTTGVIEVVHLDGPSDRTDFTSKIKRSIDDDDEYDADSTNDLRTDEAKVFRPLFVYRQRIAKQRLQRSERERRNNAARIGYEKSARLPHAYRFR